VKVRVGACLAIVGFIAGCATAPASESRPQVNTVRTAANDEVRFVTLGTGGGPVPRLKRSQPANALIVRGKVYLFDAGDGVLTQMVAAGLRLPHLRALFLSHLHIDHSADIPVLLIDRWLLGESSSLPVIGPPGSAEMVANILRAYKPVELAPVAIGGPPLPPLMSTASVKELPDALAQPREIYRDNDVVVWAVGVEHYHYPVGSPEAAFSRSYAYRIETADKSYVFTGDTGPSKALERLAKNADVLVTEVIDLTKIRTFLIAGGFPEDRIEGMMRHMAQDHLTGGEIGKLAAQAGVRSIVLTHFAPGTDDDQNYESYAAGIADHFDGPVSLASDLDSF
jgi:ribonuclease BN (tRNA processing enzyme)